MFNINKRNCILQSRKRKTQVGNLTIQNRQKIFVQILKAKKTGKSGTIFYTQISDLRVLPNSKIESIKL